MSAKLLRVWNGKKVDAATAVAIFTSLNYVDNPAAFFWKEAALTDLVPADASVLEDPHGTSWVWAQFLQGAGVPTDSEVLWRRRLQVSWLQAPDRRSPQ